MPHSDISEKDRMFLVNLKQEDITRKFIEDNFVSHYNKDTKKVEEPRLSWQDEFYLKPGECHNKSAIAKTNVGLFIVNKFIFEGILDDVLGYWNETISDGVLGKIEDKIHKALLDDKISVDDYAEYQNRLQWILAIHTMVCGSFTPKTMAPLKKVTALRDKLFKENADALAKGDAVTALKIEKELLEEAHKELDGDPGMELFDSGARGNFNNNYKCINVMRGPIFDMISGKYKIAKSSFNEGIDRDNIPELGSTVTMGAYPKAVGTAVGGYTVKRFNAAFQNVVLDKKGSDCHSHATLDIVLTKGNREDCMYRYIVEGKKLVRLDDHNIDKYMGKTIHLRSPLYCTGENICNICYGDKPYMVGLKNVGLTFSKIGSNFVNLGMKSFHDTSMKLEKINPEDVLL